MFVEVDTYVYNFPEHGAETLALGSFLQSLAKGNQQGDVKKRVFRDSVEIRDSLGEKH
jgi:hypothetical protein